MSLDLKPPITYLITSGATSDQTKPQSEAFQAIVHLVEVAANAGVSLVQLREKQLKPQVLYELAVKCASITRAARTRLLINDRADIAYSAGAHGVHLTTRSIPSSILRGAFGSDFLIGVSTHYVDEVRKAQADGADFVTFGPVFRTPSKERYGVPAGLEKLREAAASDALLPVLALGGITLSNSLECLRAGAAGIASIRLFCDACSLPETVRELETQNARL